jgi:hypothetical protein
MLANTDTKNCVGINFGSPRQGYLGQICRHLAVAATCRRHAGAFSVKFLPASPGTFLPLKFSGGGELSPNSKNMLPHFLRSRESLVSFSQIQRNNVTLLRKKGKLCPPYRCPLILDNVNTFLLSCLWQDTNASKNMMVLRSIGDNKIISGRIRSESTESEPRTRLVSPWAWLRHPRV